MKTRRWFVCVVMLLSLTGIARAAEKSAVVFSSLPFVEASALAAKENKLIFIDFFTTWCAPCKMLDAQTWTDAEVGALVNAKAVALKLDAEKEGKELAQRFHVQAYPTMLVLKADGTVVDRLIGFREPKRFIADFQDAVNGRSSLTRATAAVVAAAAGPSITKDLVDSRYQLGKVQATEGNHVGALENFLWCFDEGMPAVSSYTGVRLSFLLGDIERLSAHIPDARTALLDRCARAEEAMLTDASNRQAPADFSALVATLKDFDRMVRVYEMLPPGDRRITAMGHRLYGRLRELKRYDDALKVYPFAQLKSRLENYLQLNSRPNLSQLIIDANRRLAINTALDSIEVLAGAGQIAQARELQAVLFAFDRDPATIKQMNERVTLVGHPELVEPPPEK